MAISVKGAHSTSVDQLRSVFKSWYPDLEVEEWEEAA